MHEFPTFHLSFLCSYTFFLCVFCVNERVKVLIAFLFIPSIFISVLSTRLCYQSTINETFRLLVGLILNMIQLVDISNISFRFFRHCLHNCMKVTFVEFWQKGKLQQLSTHLISLAVDSQPPQVTANLPSHPRDSQV